jgi:hypothetical protein
MIVPSLTDTMIPAGRDFTVYAAYILATLIGFVIGHFLRVPAMRYVFLIYLIGIFAFTGALPYLVDRPEKGGRGYAWNLFLRFAFPLLACVGTALVVAILIKVRM